MPQIFTPLPDKPDHNALELEILDRWERESTFDRLRAMNDGGPRFSFVEICTVSLQRAIASDV